MKFLQISMSPDGAYIYALDTYGSLWVARTKVEGFDGGGINLVPDWNRITMPPDDLGGR